MRKKYLSLFLLALLGLAIIFFLKTHFFNEAPKVKVGVIFSSPGIGDKSFNDSAYKGLLKARNKLNVIIEYIEPQSFEDIEEEFKEFASGDYDLIIAVGYGLKSSCEDAALLYPNKHFVILDELLELSNVSSIKFKENEGAFLAGFLASRVTNSNIVGFVGGNRSEVVERFRVGYIQGVKYGNPAVEVRECFVDGDCPFGDVAGGKREALSLICNGADVILHASGESGLGVIETAKEKDIFVIGVDVDQNIEAPHHVITSIIKRTDIAIFDIISESCKGQKIGNKVLGLKDKGIELAVIKPKGKVPKSILNELNELKKRVKDGDIIVEGS